MKQQTDDSVLELYVSPEISVCELLNEEFYVQAELTIPLKKMTVGLNFSIKP